QAAEAIMRQTLVAKQGTDEEVAGQNLLISLKNKVAQGTREQTELERVNEQIAKQHLDTENVALAQQLRAQAQIIDQRKQEQELQQVTNKYKEQTAALELKIVGAQRMSNTELQHAEQLQKLDQQYRKDLEKYPNDINKITEAYKRERQAILDVQHAEEQEKKSFQGFTDGATQAFANFAEGATNANKVGNQFVSQGLNGMATALSEVGQKGSQAFKDLAVSMLQMIEQAAAKILIVEGIAMAVTAIWGTAAGDAVWELAGGKPKGFANGGVFSGGVQAFADGGVVSQPTYFNMGLMGEAGPEAIMPLQRDSQ